MIAGRLAESEHLIDLLRNVTHEGLPEEINRDTSLDLRNMTSSFKDDYTVLSVLGAFLERSRMDEELFHSGEYVSMYDRIEERHYSAMCSLHGLVASLNDSIDVIIDREDVIPSDFHEESVFARSLRDFVTVNETENFYINLLSKYESII
ncbi:uncharacterized protein [Argopecten irradians]|uniref:uncharacterized protein n=1 Tax=Argopecten irradians TaxID=31199 RepID=UPI00371C3D33